MINMIIIPPPPPKKSGHTPQICQIQYVLCKSMPLEQSDVLWSSSNFKDFTLLLSFILNDVMYTLF